jgi:hypothetical protein
MAAISRYSTRVISGESDFQCHATFQPYQNRERDEGGSLGEYFARVHEDVYPNQGDEVVTRP